MLKVLGKIRTALARGRTKVEPKDEAERVPMGLDEALGILTKVEWERPYYLDWTIRGKTEKIEDDWRGSLSPTGFQVANLHYDPAAPPEKSLSYVYCSLPDPEIGWKGFLEIETDAHVVKFWPPEKETSQTF